MCTRPTQSNVRPNHALHLTSWSSTHPVTVCRISLCDLVLKTLHVTHLALDKILTTRVFILISKSSSQPRCRTESSSCEKKGELSETTKENFSHFNQVPKHSKHVFSQGVYDPPGQGLWRRRRRCRGQACQEPYCQDVSQRSHSNKDLGACRADSHYEHALLQRPGHPERTQDCYINVICFTPLRREFRPLPDWGVFTSHKPRFAFPP